MSLADVKLSTNSIVVCRSALFVSVSKHVREPPIITGRSSPYPARSSIRQSSCSKRRKVSSARFQSVIFPVLELELSPISQENEHRIALFVFSLGFPISRPTELFFPILTRYCLSQISICHTPSCFAGRYSNFAFPSIKSLRPIVSCSVSTPMTPGGPPWV